MGFARQEHWSGLPCPPPGALPDPGIGSVSTALQGSSLPLCPPGSTLPAGSPALIPGSGFTCQWVGNRVFRTRTLPTSDPALVPGCPRILQPAASWPGPAKQEPPQRAEAANPQTRGQQSYQLTHVVGPACHERRASSELHFSVTKAEGLARGRWDVHEVLTSSKENKNSVANDWNL